MDKRLSETVERLRRELSSADDVDPETLALLRSVTDDIDRLVAKRGKTTASEVEPVTSGLRDLVLRFEADHPQLSVAIGKVADALAAMGI
jgi:hypothetical protein